MFKYSSIQTVFIATDEDTINLWLLRKGKEIQLKRKKTERASATLIMETVLKDMGGGVGVRCENRSLVELSDEPSCNTTEKLLGKTYSHRHI